MAETLMYQALAAIFFETLLGGFVLSAGMCARRRTYFLLLRQKKVGKEKATLLSATPSLRYGATCVATLAGCAAKLTSRCALRSNTAASQITKHARSDAHATPQALRRRRIQKGWGTTRAIAALGPQRAGASRREGQAERSDGPSRGFPSGRAEERRARGGMRVGARMLRCLTRRGCLSGARSAQRVPRRTPRPSTAGCPQRSGGTRTAGRVSLGTFLPRSKKVPRPPGRVPASNIHPHSKDQKRAPPPPAHPPVESPPTDNSACAA